MKKLMSFASFAMLCILFVSGCSCNKVSENTYNNAINNFNNTDAIDFTRVEREYDKNNPNPADFIQKTINATYVFNSNRQSEIADFVFKYKDNKGTLLEYFYKNDVLYKHHKVDSTKDTKYKQTIKFDNYFNVNRCKDNICLIAIPSNIAPIYEYNNINNFKIEKFDDGAIATYSAACPSYEMCASSDENITYTLKIASNGNIKNLEYSIDTETKRYQISYLFNGFGTGEIKQVAYPRDDNQYKEEKFN